MSRLREPSIRLGEVKSQFEWLSRAGRGAQGYEPPPKLAATNAGLGLECSTQLFEVLSIPARLSNEKNETFMAP